MPIAAAQTPVTALGSLVSTGSPLKAVGVAAASVTGAANAALTPLIDNDVFLVVPKAFHALDVAVVEVVNIGATVSTPGQFTEVLQRGRANIRDALDSPVGSPTTPTGARNIVQVASVEAINVTTAVAFQAGELLLAGVVQTADASAQELARSGDPVAALAAGAARARAVLDRSSVPVVAAVDTAVTNIGNSLHDPFPSVAPGTAISKHPTVDISESFNQSTESKREPTDSEVTAKKRQSTSGSSPSSSSSSRSATGSTSASASATGDVSNDSATPSAKKNTMNNEPPR